jgi:hypothetical protein
MKYIPEGKELCPRIEGLAIRQLSIINCEKLESYLRELRLRMLFSNP